MGQAASHSDAGGAIRRWRLKHLGAKPSRGARDALLRPKGPCPRADSNSQGAAFYDHDSRVQFLAADSSSEVPAVISRTGPRLEAEILRDGLLGMPECFPAMSFGRPLLPSRPRISSAGGNFPI